MRATILLNPDTAIAFPEFVLLKASAGTGKTHALTLRFTQFLLSERIKNNDPRQMLAITFTRNAAREMKMRVIQWLKDCYFGREETLSQVKELVALSEENLKARAQLILETLLSRYTDFQVMTIDSFMAEVFRASAVDLGVSPDFEITLNASPFIDYAFYRFLRKVTPSSAEGKRLAEVVASLQALSKTDAAFVWDPTSEIKDKFIELYSQLEAMNRQPRLEDRTEELAGIQEKVQRAATSLEKKVEDGELASRQMAAFWSMLPKIKKGYLNDLLDKTWDSPPFKQPRSGNERQNRAYESALSQWQEFLATVNAYKKLYAQTFFFPFLRTYVDLISLLAEVKKEKGVVFLEDINRRLASYLSQGIVPDVYFRLGERIYHYLIDEFQDTSPLQWTNLRPLIENSLSQGGSLFIVGDSKQAIFGFRKADYEIMMNLEKGREFFSSVETQVKELIFNRRSRKEILDFVQLIFPHGIKKLKKYAAQAAKSGLDDYEVAVSEARPLGPQPPGYVEVHFIDRQKESAEAKNGEEGANETEDELADQESRVKSRVQAIIAELKARGYRFSDMAILTYRNEKAIQVAAWLNEQKTPFIPFSALDIRKRRVIKEILALLRFLDFPPDNLSLSTCLLGELFTRKLAREGELFNHQTFHDFFFRCHLNQDYPAYAALRRQYPTIWQNYFEPLFKSVGYLPLYDLTTQLYRLFNIFDLFPEEEAALVRFLEVIKEFEGTGKNSLREFLLFASETEGDESVWTIAVAPEVEAVRIMTIHKAKGLGFPVVILLLYPERKIYPLFYLEEGESSDEGSAVRVLKLNKSIAQASPELASVYEQFQIKDDVNRLNTLYVALTRARRELYVIAVRGKRKEFPIDIFEELALTQDYRYAAKEKKPPAKRKKEELAGKTAATLKIPATFSLPLAEEKSLRREETRRGEIIHSLLATIEYIDQGFDLSLASSAAKLKKVNPQLEIPQEIINLLSSFLTDAALRPYFEPKEGRVVFREMELVGQEGALYRADRVVIDPDLITVIDFKSGRIREDRIKEAHRNQLRNYQQILREVYPEKAVQGLLVYLDEKSWEIVE
ncbi:MAG: UvrD-helicase domain-containing protein [Candidatus Aminicenantales bacterium]